MFHERFRLRRCIWEYLDVMTLELPAAELAPVAQQLLALERRRGLRRQLQQTPLSRYLPESVLWARRPPC